MNTTQRCLFLKSSDASYLTQDESEAHFVFAPSIEFPDNTNLSILLQSFQCYAVFAPVNSTNNQLSCSSGTFTLNTGNYNAYTMSAYLGTLLSPITVTYDESLHFVFSSENVFTIYKASTCLGLLGFSNADHSGTSFMSDQLIDLSLPRCLAINTSLTVANYSSDETSSSYSSLLATVPISNVSYGDLISYQNGLGSFVTLKDHHISSLRLNVTAVKTGLPVDFQGTSWSCTLVIRVDGITDSVTSLDPSKNIMGIINQPQVDEPT
jgi:hypothetical protein